MKKNSVTPAWLTLSLLVLFLLPVTSMAQATSGKTSTPGTMSCTRDNDLPSEGENQLAQHNYTAAEQFYREAITKNSQDPRSYLGLTRALIGLNKVKPALDQAAEMQSKFPKTALAYAAQSEAAYRAGDPDESQRLAVQGLKANPCEAQALYAFANVAEAWGFYGTAWRVIKNAHAIRPNDELIHREWIWLMPRSQRANELELYMKASNHLDDKSRPGYERSLERLKASSAGRCHLSSTSDESKIEMKPIYGDHSSPQAFGLDVFLNSKRRRMQIDTGASGIVLTATAAHALGLAPEYHLKSTGVGDDGPADSYITHVKEIRIGNVQLENCMVEVLTKKSHLDEIDGLIGMDVFHSWMVTLDYQGFQLRLNRLPPRAGSTAKDDNDDDIPQDPDKSAPELKDFHNVIRIGHQIMLPAYFKKEKMHFLVMDTGAQATTISPDMGRELGKLATSGTTFYGISGEAKKVWESNMGTMVVGNLQMNPAEYYVLESDNLSSSNEFETAGLFGLDTLQRISISIDYRDNLVKLSYDPKRDRALFNR